MLSALLFQRPGNIRAMEWAEVGAVDDSRRQDEAHDHPRALTSLAELRPLTGHGRFVFPSLLTGERCMSENTIRSALRRMGYSNDEMTAHGFRAMARTIMVEKLNMHPDVIEAQLAHGKSGPLGMAYDRAEFMEQRRAMMNAWADFLDKLRSGAKVLPFKAASA